MIDSQKNRPPLAFAIKGITIIDMKGPFVIQRHQTNEGVHFDLMLRRGQTLMTFQLPTPPNRWSMNQSLEAAQLPDHRVAYLSYEGPVSHGRGSVRIVDHGQYDWQKQNPSQARLTLDGHVFKGVLQLDELGQNRWRIKRLSEQSSHQ